MEFPKKLFDLKHIPDRPVHSINHCAKFSALRDVEEAVGPEVWQQVCESPLGNIIKFSKLNFEWSSRLVHYAIINQLVCEKPYEIWSLLSGKPARFSLYEFEEVTLLNCKEFPEDQPAVDEAEKDRFWNLLKLRRSRNSPCFEDLQKLVAYCRSWSREDKIRLCYLIVMCNGFLAVDRREAIPLQYATQVIDLDRFEEYPWGRACFYGLIRSVKKVGYNKLQQTSYTLKGFVQVLQIWLYLAVPKVVSNLGISKTTEVPPLLRYRGKVGKLPLDEVFFGTNVRVRHMANFKDGLMHPVWGFIDRDDKKIDNLISYILAKRPLGAIKWLQKPSVPKRKKGTTEDMVEAEAEEADNVMVTSRGRLGKRTGLNRKTKRLSTEKTIASKREWKSTGQGNKRKADGNCRERVSKRGRRSRRLEKILEENEGEAEEEDSDVEVRNSETFHRGTDEAHRSSFFSNKKAVAHITEIYKETFRKVLLAVGQMSVQVNILMDTVDNLRNDVDNLKGGGQTENQ